MCLLLSECTWVTTIADSLIYSMIVPIKKVVIQFSVIRIRSEGFFRSYLVQMIKHGRDAKQLCCSVSDLP